MSTLGERIKLARGKTSQDAFAKLIQVSKGSLGFYERNENLPNTDVVLKICSETDVSLEWLMTGEGPMRVGEKQPETRKPVSVHTIPESVSKPYNRRIMQEVIEGLEEALEITNKTMPPQGKSEIICDIYEHFEAQARGEQTTGKALKLFIGALAANDKKR